ncbi:hypothetical protein Syun_022059 [Stephania yunnanensis]|uniref:C2 domain-containing protein n=1 Tax=Stephania yunnanensis TaxID=152371 RepID=A0AAP0IIQ4_9MAGN
MKQYCFEKHLRIHVYRGLNLAIKDKFKRSSDPYVLVTWGKQKVRTSYLKRNLNPEWNEELTLCVEDPNLPLKLEVYDHDTFSSDDKMGFAEFDVKPLLDALEFISQEEQEGLLNDTIVKKVIPSRTNCLAEESCIVFKNNRVVQDMCLRLRDVKNGELELQLELIHDVGSKS